MIPKTIHRIWLKGNDRLPSGPMPQQYVEWGERWRELNPGWTLKDWTEVTFDLRNAPWMDAANNWGAKSDILRYEILYKFGGIYVDCDVEPLKPIEPLIQHFDCFASMSGGTAANFFMGCTPKHRVMNLIIERIRTRKPGLIRNMQLGDTFDWTGPGLITPIMHGSADATVFEQRVACADKLDPFEGSFSRHHQRTTWVDRSRVGKEHLPCSHRGDVIETRECKKCRKSIKIKVFECTKHERCSMAQVFEDMPNCKGCRDFDPVEQVPDVA